MTTAHPWACAALSAPFCVALSVALLGPGTAAAAEPPAARDSAADGSPDCVYHSAQWDVVKKRNTNGILVHKPYAQVTDDERDPADRRCTVCRGDQTRIDPKRLGLAKLGGFSVCWAYAQQVEKALETIAKAGDFDLKAVVGYRPGRTRGAVVDGKRTQWSNHSFGTAIDLNAFANGLHASCNVSQATPATVKRCKLRIGGAWDPEGRPRLTVTAASSPYRAFAPFWKWGGEISGDIKDFMHFSISGY